MEDSPREIKLRLIKRQVRKAMGLFQELNELSDKDAKWVFDELSLWGIKTGLKEKFEALTAELDKKVENG